MIATTRIHGASAGQDLLSCISQVVSCPYRFATA